MSFNTLDEFYDGNTQLNKTDCDYYFKDKYHFQAEEIEHKNDV